MRLFLPSRRLLRRWLFGLAGLLISLCLWGTVSAVRAQNVILIPNTATASFQETPGGPVTSVTSNQTTVTANVSSSGLEIIKTGNRAAAEPGDSVIYRVLVKNTGTAVISNLQVTDTLPFGVRFIANSAKAAIGATTSGSSTAVTLQPPTQKGRVLTFFYPSLAPNQTLTLAYAVVLTPDAIRGNGRNVAIAQGLTPGGSPISSNTATYRVAIRAGILSDCGTIVGRVFVDKNFDGEQQPGEPGVPNAVIYFDDGNRITTDSEGLYSLAFVIAGTRSATLDLSSLPGYTIAPNLYRLEANSTSRMVRLSPGGLGRMNFAVTPTFQEGQR